MSTELEKPRPSCFVVMPFGRDATEQKWFRGWYEVVLAPAVHLSGYEPVLSASEEQPGAINDEIRIHLAYDPMVLVDLGGFEPADDPNPNVMYELGMRHALGLPLVIMAWQGQRLPFDVANQRVIMHDRDLLDIDANRKKIVSFIQAAAAGKYYKPMEAVGRVATLAAASEGLEKDSVLAALVQEVKELKSSVHSVVENPRRQVDVLTPHTVRSLLGTKTLRKSMYSYVVELGGAGPDWNQIMRQHVSPEFAQAAKAFNEESWKSFMEAALRVRPTSKRKSTTKLKQPELPLLVPNQQRKPLDDNIVKLVFAALPEQPWPKDTHKEVRSKLNITGSQYTRSVEALINSGRFKRQINGALEDGQINQVLQRP